jgi:hypothetical protein
MGKVSRIGWPHLYLIAIISITRFLLQQEKGEYEEGGGKGWELTLCLTNDIFWVMHNPMPEFSLTPLHS